LKRTAIALTCFLFLALLSGCAHKQPTAQAPPPPQPTTTAEAAVAPPAACGALLTKELEHVYHPDRLTTQEPCKTVTGTIDLVRSEPDGDYHIRLKLDPGQGHLTNARNDAIQGGDLVVEPICEHKVTQADAVASCQGFSGGVAKPKKGMHVKVTGPYVLDTEGNHGWMEIHPAVMIEEVP
jgi:hypothetical protein